ncbi:Sugar efflux transporter for intercellular exchange [Phytophthora infestans]|uniref:Sugar efflux transporter for intercellular exchange n=1 Tax=Phytophthora infestans TaxID=4787 RepID=A0A833SI73_PHYIN|nr:Sugar efflux transporter for intercellular exchange [Phytophthora infestans]
MQLPNYLSALCKTDVIHLLSSTQEKILGNITVLINVALYASSLEIMKLVLQTKSVASLFATMYFVNLVSRFIYGILADDTFVRRAPQYHPSGAVYLIP